MTDQERQEIVRTLNWIAIRLRAIQRVLIQKNVCTKAEWLTALGAAKTQIAELNWSNLTGSEKDQDK